MLNTMKESRRVVQKCIHIAGENKAGMSSHIIYERGSDLSFRMSDSLCISDGRIMRATHASNQNNVGNYLLERRSSLKRNVLFFRAFSDEPGNLENLESYFVYDGKNFASWKYNPLEKIFEPSLTRLKQRGARYF